MVFHNNLVVAIKVAGKILRETKDLVKLPYGTEFTVLVKNLNSRRAKFTLHIDGTDVLDGTEIIVNGNCDVEMKRFIRNGNMTEGNAYKFIERTTAIEDGPRGIKSDDGIVRIEYWFEQPQPEIKKTIYRNEWWDSYYNRPTYLNNTIGQRIPPYDVTATGYSETRSKSVPLDSSALRGMSQSLNNASATATVSTASCNVSFNSAVGTFADTTGTFADKSDKFNNESLNDVGITVPGSRVEQSFQTVYGFMSEANSSVIIIRLTGFNGEVEVVAPVTVKTKSKCSTCHKLNKATSNFCSGCGTSLTLL